VIAPSVIWNPEVPEDIRRAIGQHLDRWLPFVPRWCHEVIIGWESRSDDADLDTTTTYEYRWAKIMVRPSFLNRTQDERSNEVLHEILHVALAPWGEATGAVLDFVREKHPDVYEWAKEQRRMGMETTISDLAESIDRAMG
jgi:hypothetical protein